MRTIIHVCNVNGGSRYINNDYWKGFTFISSLNQGASNVTICVEACTLDGHNARSGKRATGMKCCESCGDFFFFCYPHLQQVRLHL